ncbi:MAG TPA: GNAT family N-acetyltransferase [Bdellovibrionales bacterium]|nr:GNAT family N-acetyltransferase [Bdellovibrionales bacterium]
MGLTFRRLTATDLDSCFNLRLKGLQEAPSAFLITLEEQRAEGPERFRQILAETGCDNVIFGALRGREVVGTCCIFLEERQKVRHKAVVWGMYVDPAFRKSGAGGALLDLAIRHARDEMKASVVELSVEGENHAARRLYESRGFKRWGRQPRAMFHGGRYFDEDYMSLRLD